MQLIRVLTLTALVVLPSANGNPLDKVLQLMDDLTAKLVKDGEAEAKAFAEFVEWCDDTSKNGNNEITTYTTKQGKLEAKIAELTEESEAASAKIDDLAGRIKANEKDLSDATAIFDKDTKDFEAAEAELASSVDTLARAISVIEREMAKNPAAFAQIDTSGISGLINAINVVTDAAAFNIADKQKLTALIQDQDGDAELSAPAAANYKSHSGGILDVLQDMKDKADGQLDSLRKEFVKTTQSYNMMKQSLESQIGADNKALSEEKAARAAAEEGKATAEGDLATTVKLLAEAKSSLASANSNCMKTAADHDQSIKDRAEELKVIATAKKILSETTSGASGRTYSLFQLMTSADLAGKEVVTLVKKLADENGSKSLAQLASKISAVMQFGASAGADPFAKVKGLLEAMIAKLENEANEASEEKAYCDEQMSKTEAKKSDLEDDVEKLNVKIDQATSASTGLKEDVNILQEELAALAKEQAEMDKSRSDSHAAYLAAKADLESGLGGVRKALGVLKDYYGGSAASASMLQQGMGEYMRQPTVPTHSASSGAGGSIIDILTVCESDFAKNLADVESVEADELADYEKTTQANEVTKTTKEQDSKYKTQEFKTLDSNIAEMKGDLKSTSAELDAVLNYYEQVKQRCVAKAETYSERVKRRTAEIKGLKEALSILENETAFTQSRKRGHRGHFLGQ